MYLYTQLAILVWLLTPFLHQAVLALPTDTSEALTARNFFSKRVVCSTQRCDNNRLICLHVGCGPCPPEQQAPQQVQGQPPPPPPPPQFCLEPGDASGGDTDTNSFWSSVDLNSAHSVGDSTCASGTDHDDESHSCPAGSSGTKQQPQSPPQPPATTCPFDKECRRGHDEDCPGCGCVEGGNAGAVAWLTAGILIAYKCGEAAG